VNGSPDLDTGIETPTGPSDGSLSFLAPALEPDEVGRLAHYRVLKVLGQGGMGIVLLAEDTQLQRPVALKVIRPEIGQTPSNRQRFLREARAMAQVRSDHVVTVHQVGQVDDVCYLAMELLEGEPLDRWLDRVQVSPVDEVLRIGREIALALAAAHARGLVHRDVKPANIWLEGPARRVKLLDFGLARPQTGDSQLTNPGMVVGTPMYMAPEQAMGESIDGRADLFSLGCVLYRMATGRPPFEGKSSLAVLSAIVGHNPPSAVDLNPAVPPAFADLLVRLLAKKPGGRPTSAEAVARELQAVERTALVTLGPPATQHTLIALRNPPESPNDLLWSGVQPQSSNRLRGELFLAESPDRRSDAEACFSLAIETARRQQSRGWELRATTSLARLWRQAGRRDEARAALAAIYESYTEGFATPDLSDAKSLMNSLS
jgi:serine/threonine protein kinase